MNSQIKTTDSLQKRIADFTSNLARELDPTPKVAVVVLQIGNLKISLTEGQDFIAIDRDGEGGHFSIHEFHDLVQGFVSARL